MLTGWVSPYGYNLVSLSKSTRKDVQIFRHRVVALGFLPPRPEGHEINHKDGNKLNNHPDNLEWVTRGENIRHSFQTGLRPAPRGELAGLAKLKDSDIGWIWAWRGAGMTQRDIGEMFGVSECTIGDILRGKTWTHICPHSESRSVVG